MVILQQPEAFSLASDLKDLFIESNEKVTVRFQTRGNVFLEETYSPDAENKIAVRDLGRLFLPYLLTFRLIEPFSIALSTPSGETKTIDCRVQYCRLKINQKAESFLSSHFLTGLQEEKIIYPFQKEYLSFVATERTEVEISARYASGKTVKKTAWVLEPPSADPQVLTVEVSPSLFEHPETILYAVATAGERTFAYVLRRSAPRNPVQFLFLNSFGVKETFIPFASITRENKYENQFGVFNGNYRKYGAELVKEYTARTGVLTQGMADWIEELFLSRNVFLLSQDGIEQEATLTEATLQRSSARDELPNYAFKYRAAPINQNELTIRGARIFDLSFNYTFN